MLHKGLKLPFVAFPLIAALSCGGNTDRTHSGSNAGTGGGAGTRGSAGATGGSGASSGNAGSLGNGGATGGRGGSAGSGGSTGGRGGTLGTGGSGAAGSYAACSRTSDCMVRPASCCGSCGAATRSDMIAINRANVSGYTFEMCQDTGCPACATIQDPTLLARCEDGVCRVVDLNTLPLTACSTHADCRVRTASCCECGGNVALGTLIAIRQDSEAEFQQLSCDPETACDQCVPVYPGAATPACIEGHCDVVSPPP